MNRSSQASSIETLGTRIRKLRHRHGLTQEELAGPDFTKGYISALERGAIRPSLKALETLARRLEVPVGDLLTTRADTEVEPEVEALEEDLQYLFNYVRMLIRTNHVDEALDLITEAEESARPYWDKLPDRLRYLIPFSRGRAYLQLAEPNRAKPELEAALEFAKADQLEAAIVRNLLGVAFYELGHVQSALEQHLQCLDAIHKEAVKDLNLRLSIYRNLANDYWALNNPSLAIDIYNEALAVLTDLNDLERQAGVYWGMALAYKAQDDWAHAKLYAMRALHIYETADSQGEAATVCIDLAEMMIDEQRYQEAEELLNRAKNYLASIGHPGLWSLLYRYQAKLAQWSYSSWSEYRELECWYRYSSCRRLRWV